MDNFKFVELALYNEKSKFFSGWSEKMKGVYRDVDSLVATDGRRMHMVHSLPITEKDNREYVDWQRILPTVAENGSCVIMGGSIALKQMKTLLKFVELSDACHYQVTFSADREKRLWMSFLSGSNNASFGISTGKHEGEPFTFKINLSYFIESLKPMFSKDARLSYYAESRCIILDNKHNNFKALIGTLRD